MFHQVHLSDLWLYSLSVWLDWRYLTLTVYKRIPVKVSILWIPDVPYTCSHQRWWHTVYCTVNIVSLQHTTVNYGFWAVKNYNNHLILFMFRFPLPSLLWRWVGRSGKKKKQEWIHDCILNLTFSLQYIIRWSKMYINRTIKIF